MCHDGARVELADKLASIKNDSALYKVSGPFGETPQAV